MTYQEIVEKAKELYEGVTCDIQEHIAYQFNVTGEGEGAFYMEISEGKIHVEPFEYYDRDALITTTAENLLEIATAELDPVHAFLTGKIKVQGDIGKASMLKELSEKAAETAKAALAADSTASAESAGAAKKTTAGRKKNRRSSRKK